MDGGSKKEVSYTENIILPGDIRPEIITMQAPTKFTLIYTLGSVRDTIEEDNANASIGNRVWYIFDIHSLTNNTLSSVLTEKIE